MKSIPFVDLNRQYDLLKKDIDAAIAEVIENTAFIGGRGNSWVTRFEQEWAEYLGAEHVVACANGTDALEILLEAYGIGPGDEVIVPAMTWISTAGAVARVGAQPVFVDIHPARYTMDPDQIETAITPATRAIIPVHLYGMPADMDAISAIGCRHNLVIIEDAAQAHGTEYHGRKAGTLADAAIFSFYPGKNLGAFGDAGCLTTNNAEIAEVTRQIANHGQKVKHNHQRLGRNSRMDGIHAAVLSVKLPYLDRWNQERIQIAERYTAHFTDIASVKVPSVPDYCRHVFHVYMLLTDDVAGMQLSLGSNAIASGSHYPNVLADLPFLTSRAGAESGGDYRNARTIAANGISIPVFPAMENTESDRVIEVVMQTCRRS